MTDNIGALIVLALILSAVIGFVIRDNLHKNTDWYAEHRRWRTEYELLWSMYQSVCKQLKGKKRDGKGRFVA